MPPIPCVLHKGLKRLKWALTGFFLLRGLTTLGTFVKIGIEHAPNAGELYTPARIEARR